MGDHSSNNVCGHAEQALGSSRSRPRNPDLSVLYKQWRQARLWPRQRSVRTDPDEGDPAMLIEPHIPEPSERSVLLLDDSFSSLWRSSRSTPHHGKLIESWLDGPWLPLLSGNGCIGSNNPSPLSVFSTSLAYLRMASGFPPFTRDTPRYHKTKHIAILIWNHTTRVRLIKSFSPSCRT
jgi:hypothetical protein